MEEDILIHVPKDGLEQIHAKRDLIAFFEYAPVIEFSTCHYGGNFEFTAAGPVSIHMKNVTIGGDCKIVPKGEAILIIDSKCKVGGKLLGWTRVVPEV